MKTKEKVGPDNEDGEMRIRGKIKKKKEKNWEERYVWWRSIFFLFFVQTIPNTSLMNRFVY